MTYFEKSVFHHIEDLYLQSFLTQITSATDRQTEFP